LLLACTIPLFARCSVLALPVTCHLFVARFHVFTRCIFQPRRCVFLPIAHAPCRDCCYPFRRCWTARSATRCSGPLTRCVLERVRRFSLWSRSLALQCAPFSMSFSFVSFDCRSCCGRRSTRTSSSRSSRAVSTTHRSFSPMAPRPAAAASFEFTFCVDQDCGVFSY
jgi:hypothetical protein